MNASVPSNVIKIIFHLFWSRLIVQVRSPDLWQNRGRGNLDQHFLIMTAISATPPGQEPLFSHPGWEERQQFLAGSRQILPQTPPSTHTWLFSLFKTWPTPVQGWSQGSWHHCCQAWGRPPWLCPGPPWRPGLAEPQAACASCSQRGLGSGCRPYVSIDLLLRTWG